MTIAATRSPAIATPNQASAQAGEFVSELPEGYEAIRADPAVQYEPLKIKQPEPYEPSWFEEMLQAFFEWLGEIFSPVGGALSTNWSIIQWILIAVLAAFVLYLAVRLIGPLIARGAAVEGALEVEPEWQPDREESLALLEDADRLAGEGRFEEAVRLLLKRSVGQIAKAKPDWVHPSSTARELASLQGLSAKARQTFSVISGQVESSLFALEKLSGEDWQRARDAYADFALARIEARAPSAEAPS